MYIHITYYTTYFHFKETNLHSNETCIAALLLSKKEVLHSINMFAITLGKLLRGEKMVLVFFKPRICYHFMLKKCNLFGVFKKENRILQNTF